MQDSTNPRQKPTRIDFLVFEQFSNHCLANALEPFRAANTLAGSELYHWQFYTPDGMPVTSSSGLPIIPHGAIDDRPAGDLLFIISSYGHRQLNGAKLRRRLVHASQRSKIVVGLDSGAWLMASAGLLNGYRATIHRDLIESLSEAFLKVEIVQSGYVIDGNRITCGGAMAAFDLVLELIGKAHGAVLRMDIAALFLHGDAGSQTASMGKNASGTIITRALAIMQSSIETPLNMAELCQRLDCHIKTLERRFQKQMKQNPSQVFRHLRLMEARRMVENTDLPVTEIAVRSGYENASAMTRAFKAKFGMTPRALRKDN